MNAITTSAYPDQCKDALVPDPYEFDFSDPDAKVVHETCQTAEGRLYLFERLMAAADADESAQKSN